MAEITVQVDSAIATCANHINEISNVANNLGNINTVIGNSSNINKVAAIDDDVTTVAGIDDKVSAVADNETNINAVNSNKTNIDTVAGNITNVNTVAGISSNVTTVAGISSDITAVVDNETNINSVASDLTKINSVADDLTNINKVADNETNINAVNSNKTNINTVASNKTYINVVAHNITNINKVADNETNINSVNANSTYINAVATNIPYVKAVANNETNINAVNSNKNNIDVCATNITSITNAPTAATTAAQQAGIATSQANIATQQAALAKQYAEETHGASDVTIANLRASSAYLNYEYPQTDSEGLADVTKYAHSTFDLSKFTKVGTPIITNDGIASGFSSGNYLTTSLSSVLPSSITSVTFECEFIYQTGTSTIFGCPAGANNSPRIHISNDAVLHFYLFDGTDDNDPKIVLSDIAQSGDTIKARVTYSNTNVTGSLSINGGTPITKSNNRVMNVNFVTALATIALGHFGSSYSTCPINLKQFSITVDGLEVFSGNKTGIDTIKPDDYTVVGTPTISADGIASGFSSSNYLSKNLTFPSINKSIDIITPIFDITNTYSALESLFEIYNQTGSNDCCFIRRNSTTNLQIYFRMSDRFLTKEFTIQQGNSYQIRLKWDGSTYYIYGKTNNSDWSLLNSSADSNVSDRWGNCKIYLGSYGGDVFGGTLDLNAFKIYVDGNLIYQPCLKIPYTLSKTGSKIVDSVYRDRVNDMYEQFGYAPYYTLLENKKGNYTVVGSPTISGDFVASGFSTSNYLTISNNVINKLINATNFNFIFRFKTGNSLGSGGLVLGNGNVISGGTFSLWVNASTVAPIVFLNESGTATLKAIGNLTKTINTNTEYEAYFSKNGNNYGFGIRELNEENYTQSEGITNANSIYSNEQTIGRNNILTSIDLKEFKIYVDNKLAYEAVTDPNFTIPQGEIYGLIGQQTLRKSSVSGINRSFLYSDRTLLLTGSCTSGVEVTLPTSFINSNYMLSVPYSAKSATAFTPTQTGDWFAIGEGAL